MTLEGVSTTILGGIFGAPTRGLSITPIVLTTTTLMTPTIRPTIAPPKVVTRVVEYSPLMSLLSKLMGSLVALAIMAEDGDKDYKVDSIGDNNDIDT